MKHFLAIMSIFSLLGFYGKPVHSQLDGQVAINPSVIPQFVDPLPHFAGKRVDASGGKLVIRYQPTKQIAVSTGTVLVNGTVGVTPGAGVGRYWGYSVSKDGKHFTPPNWPSFSIEARRGKPVKVVYENKLGGETYASVNLIVDQTLHWADPLMEMNSMLMSPYTGPVPVAPHLHGGEVPSESDGGPNSWFTPGYSIRGPSWKMGVDQNYIYPNTQEEATLWFHDHGMGVTRLNVYAGLAGFYLLRGPQEEKNKLPGWKGDDLVQEIAPKGASGTFNPKPYLPEIEIAIQDRMFDKTGALYFPSMGPNPMVHPFWTPEFIGDIITVNGKTWPYLSVAPRKYRFRLMNGSHARFYEMKIKGSKSDRYGPPIVQIGTDGGLLDAPVVMDKLLLAPGERADIVIDFSKLAPGSVWTLHNTAKAPYPDGTSPISSTTGRLMQFVVNGKMVSADKHSKSGVDKSRVPQSLRSKPLVKLTNFAGKTTLSPTIKRQLTLNEVMGMDGPLEVLVNNSKYDMNGMMTPGLGETESPIEGTTELWQIINTTADAHPIHIHLVQFQLVGRQAFNLENYEGVYDDAFPGEEYEPAVGPPLDYNKPNGDGAVGGNPAVSPFLEGKVRSANPNERGWKDTYVAYPGEVTTFVIRFAPTDIRVDAPKSSLLFAFDPGKGPGYVWHCHIIDHEDNEMMRPYTVISSPSRSKFHLADKSDSEKESDEQDSEDNELNASLRFTLDQNFPNPFSEETQIRFSVPESMPIRLTLFNQQGKTIKILINNVAPAGNNTVKINRSGLVKGIYFYQLKAGSHVETKKMIIN